jgi:hypothetical protein
MQLLLYRVPVDVFELAKVRRREPLPVEPEDPRRRREFWDVAGERVGQSETWCAERDAHWCEAARLDELGRRVAARGELETGRRRS